MDIELVDRLVLQLNRIYPQILSDKEAHRVTTDIIWQKKPKNCYQSHHVLTLELEQRHIVKVHRCSELILHVCVCVCVSLQFRNLSIPTKLRLADLLKHLHWKGEEACHEFYRGLHIHAEDVYSSLPTRVTQREMADPKWSNDVAVHPERFVLNERGPMFFLSCFSFVVGIAILYYYGDGETLRRTGPFLHCSAARLSKGAKDVLITYSEVGKQKNEAVKVL
ncbi:putative bcl10-interacting CARD protein-like isoform 2 [Scophthalmus maximus]|uniref:Putative bcl10-interacting CARD protein-like isoform 2 n=1 Tax=Scophthalmus maximus TaxID=52904 RepID=A0A2U9C1N3_SCOMX|nr:putative bcl10-interacting CARD protein-like isoform 2 [Scophthalmus maximus]